MNPLETYKLQATRRTLLGVIVALQLVAVPAPARADRSADFNKLEAEFVAARDEFVASRSKENPTDADFIRNVEDYHLWPFIPRFVALAEANPGDDTAFRCCEWIVTKNPGFAGDRAKFDSEQKAWAIIAVHHVGDDRLPKICLEAAQAASPDREKFLRNLLKQPDLSNEHAGFASLALAETLIKKMEQAERFQKEQKAPTKGSLVEHLRNRMAPEYVKYLAETDMEASKAETTQLLRTVIDRYGDVPNTISVPYFRSMSKLSDKAEKSLHALEHLTIGVEAPDIVGTDLDGNQLKLRDYRGRVVLLSFWFAGCGPCMEMVPKERELVEKFKDRPFALLAVCGDSELEVGRAAVTEHGMTWPSWFDGAGGPIARDYNILGWPTFYLLDKDGRIVGKDLDRNKIDAQVAELLEQK